MCTLLIGVHGAVNNNIFQLHKSTVQLHTCQTAQKCTTMNFKFTWSLCLIRHTYIHMFSNGFTHFGHNQGIVINLFYFCQCSFNTSQVLRLSLFSNINDIDIFLLYRYSDTIFILHLDDDNTKNICIPISRRVKEILIWR